MYKSISDSPITTLQIIKPDIIKKYYEIRSGEDRYGSLDLIKGTGTYSRIETCQGSFTLKRLGFFRPYITLRYDRSEKNEAAFFLNADKGTKITLNNNNYYFRVINLWKNQWGWVNDKNQVVIRYKPTVAASVRGDIEVSKDFLYLPYLEIVTMVGVYFLTMMEDEIHNINELQF